MVRRVARENAHASHGLRFGLLGLALAALLPACSRDSTGPADPKVRLAVAAGDGQFVQPASMVELPLRVRVTDAERGIPLDKIVVRWSIVTGAGASLGAAEPTDDIGIATVTLRAGPDTGTIRVQATADRLVGQPASFQLRVVRPPTVAAVAPATAAAGANVTITGTGFGPAVTDNTVLIGGLRGVVRTATATTIVAEVPRCALDRLTDVRVTLGAVSSNAVPLRTVSAALPSLQLARGQAVRLEDIDQLACIDLSAGPPGADYLVVLQEVSSALDLPMRYEARGLTGGTAATIAAAVPALPARDFASEWELKLRAREQAFGPPFGDDRALDARAVTGIPAVGDSRTFNVLTPEQKTRKVTATVQAVSERAILYVDRDAPSPGLTVTDLDGFGRLFDDPIYATGLGTFGPLSDIDDNDRVIIVFTPAVNALTPRQQSGFIAGYFYGCDLVTAERCAATNRGEIFYALVPDPAAQYGDARIKSVVMRSVPPVLAHELHHMINFSRRNGSLDVIWLAEGMAHAAEDITADVFTARGDLQNADDFRRPNYLRAQYYLRAVSGTSRIDIASPGSLEMRGGAWLFVKYLSGHHGGTSLLERLAGSTASGAANVAGATGRPWDELSSDFAVALFGDGAPELAGATVDPRFGFQGFDLRSALATLSGGFPSLALTVTFGDFLLSDELPSAAQSYLVLRAPASSSAPFRLAFTGPRGGPFLAGTPALSVLRLR